MQTSLHDAGQARRFLALALPWPDGVIDGIFNVVTRSLPTDPKDRVYWNHLGVKSIDDSINAIQHQITKRGATDVYGWMALGTNEAERINPKRPDSWTKGNRLAENASWFKSVFLDVDAGPGKAYATVAQAQQALADFLMSAHLPAPNLMVASGHGFHCHWTLSEAIPPAKWHDLSARLLAAVEQYKLSVDATVTLDRARILRVPGTWNNKDPEHPVKVELVKAEPAFFVEALERALGAFQPVAATITHPKVGNGALPPGMTPRAPLPGGPELAAGVVPVKRLVVIDEIDCPLIKLTLDTGGAGQANPLWHQMISMAAFCEDGRNVAHDLSSGHASYTEDETDKEFDRAVLTHQARPEIGWTSCRKMYEDGGGETCKKCPHFSKNKSPFNFVTLESNAPIPPTGLVGLQVEGWLPPLPYGYERDGINRICKVESGEDDNEPPVKKPLSDSPVYHGWLTDYPKEIHFTYTDIGDSGAAYKKLVRVEFGALGRLPEMQKELFQQGFMFEAVDAKSVGNWLVGWIDELKKVQEDRYYDNTAFGWVETDGDISGFAYNNVAWSDKPRPAPSLKGLSGHYTPRGTLSAWQTATKLVTDRQKPELEILLAIAFAAPLVGLLGDTAKGIQVFAWSRDSGAGKTTALSLAAAVWGSPVLTMQQANDTANAVDKKMGDLRSLPIIWDEFKTASDTDAFVNMLFRASSGKSKARLSSEAGYRSVNSWATILACASNAPLLDRIYAEVGRTDAGALRVFEYEIAVDNAHKVASNISGPILAAITTNYGRAGEVYAKWLGENFRAIQQDLFEFRMALEANLDNPAQERFWNAAITVLVKGAQYAKQLGLVEFHPKEILAFCRQLVRNMRADVHTNITNPMSSAVDLKTLLNSFRADLLARETIRFEAIHTGRGRPPANFVYKPYQYNAATFDKLSIVESNHDDLIRFSAKAIADWLKVRQQRGDQFGSYSPNEIIRAAIRLLKATVKPQGRLAPGHVKDPGEQKVIEISTKIWPELKSTFT